MLRRHLVACILLVLLALPATIRVSKADNDRVEDRVDLDSAFVSVFERASLLASFGESRRAYSLTPDPEGYGEMGRRQLAFEVRLLTEMGEYARADSLLARSVPLADGGDLLFYYLQRANLNLLAKRPQRALENLAYADSLSDGGYEAYREFLRLEANLDLDRPLDAVEVGEKALGRDLPASLSTDLEFHLVEAYKRAGRPEDALVLVQTLKRRVRGTNEMAALLALDYELYLQADDAPSARRTAAELARNYPRTREAERVSVDVLERTPPKNLESDELLAHAGVMIARGFHRETSKLIRLLDNRRLSSRQREERSLLKARYYYDTAEYRRAAALAKPRYQTRAYRRESMLVLARSYRRLGEGRQAAAVYVYFAKTYPNDPKAAEALYVAARLYERVGHQRSAQEALARLRKSYPSSYFGKTANLLEARHHVRRGDLERAASVLERAVKSSRRTDAAALYYLASTYGKLGRNELNNTLLKELQVLAPYCFYVNPVISPSFRRPPTTSRGEIALDGEYGLLVFLSRIRDRKEAARQNVQEAVSQTDEQPHLEPEAQMCLERGKRFLDAGFRDWGERELEYASRRCFSSPSALLELGRIYDDYGMPWRSIRLYQRVKDSIPWRDRLAYADDFLYLMYPVPYPVQVLEHASRYDLPPHLVYAMIREESRFDRNAVSRSGAVGLMQLMPETGRYVASELEIPDWGDESLLDPEINLAFGAWYASSLMRRSDDDYLQMLAAYNAGTSNAKRWFGGKDRKANVIETVDEIDFKETRLYVQRIVESANIYHTLYFDDESITFQQNP